MTIVRICRGVIMTTKAEQHLEYLNQIVIPACQNTEGNEGLFIMKELLRDLAHFLLLAFWASKEALENFAGAGTCVVVNPSPKGKKPADRFRVHCQPLQNRV